MEALLGTPSNSRLCGSVLDLQNELGYLLGTKVTNARAEHVSTTFQLPSTVVFAIPASDAENEAESGPAGDSRTPAPASITGEQPSRQISASDALTNQPQNDPVLQRTIAKKLIAALGVVDGANWTLRQVSRATQDWTFTYICKDSAQAWERQHAKQPAKVVVGEWSNKDGQDPVNMSTAPSSLSMPS